MRTRPHTRITSGGFTLLEVLIVMAIVGLVVGSAVRGFRSLTNSDLRSGATRLSGAMRYLFDRASATGKVHRLVIDFDKGKYWAEVSDDRFLMAREPETEESRAEKAEEIAAEEAEEKEKQEAQGDNQYDISRYQPEEFKPKRAAFSSFTEMAIKPVTLKGVKVASLYTPRLAEPMSSGQGYIYFFPLGQTEAALVHVSDAAEERFYSLVLHPLTGRVQIHNEYLEAQIDGEFDDEGNRIER